ncbi:NACHT domain-containing protein [Streptomyces sp. NPDC005791]|uniref:NACHT domain-containing protein n=1 Tax=Streptomyces sp. NPDC005791 TaxID=3364732 RepID=UPI0036D003D3
MNVPAGEPTPHQEAHAHDSSQIHMAGRDQYVYHSSDGTHHDQVPVPGAGRALARMLAPFCVLVTGVALVGVAYDADGWIRGPLLLTGLVCVVLTAPRLRPAVRRRRLTRSGRNPELARLQDRQLEGAAEQLARELEVLWNREMKLRRLQHPAPLPVRWVNAEEFGDHWTNIRTDDGRDAPLDLSGSSALHEVYSRIPSGRLLILGRAGAGKSVLALRFALDRLRARGPGGRVPVLFPMASWDPATQDLESWAAGRLAADHPALAGQAVSGGTVAAELLRSDRLLPVLDGFDEMSTQTRHHALRRLRASLGEADPFLLTSRADEYEAAVRQADIVLPATAAVRVEPLSVQESVDYLHRTARKLVVGGAVATKWDPVLTRLREHPSDPQVLRLRDVLTTPLMTGLARITYSDTSRDPAELLDHRRFPGRAAIEDHLLGQLVPAVTGQSERTARWLMFLAQHLTSLGTQDLEWWRLSQAGPRAARAVGALLAMGAATALLGWRVDSQTSWFGIGMPVWVPFGVLCLIAVADVVFNARESLPQYVPRTEPGRMVRPALVVVAVVCGGLLYSWLVQYTLFQVIAAAASVIFSVGHWIVRRKRRRPRAPGRPTVEKPLEDLRHGPSDASTRGPERTLREDRLATLVTLGLINVLRGGSAVWRAAGLLIFAAFAPELCFIDIRPGTGAITAVVTFVAIAVLGASSSAWCGFGASGVWLWGAGKLPWNVLGLLGEAHRLGVLRQSGAVYQFRHSRLQERLAAQAGEPAPARVSASSSRIEELRLVRSMLSSIVLAVGSVAMGVDMFLLKAESESGPYEAVAPVCELIDREALGKVVPDPGGEPSQEHDYGLVRRYCTWDTGTPSAGDPVVVIIVDLLEPISTLTAVESADGLFGHGLPVGPIVSQHAVDLGGVGDEAVTAVGHSEDRPTVATSVRLDNLLVTVTYEVDLKWGDTQGYARSTGITQDLARTVARNISDAHS